MKNIALCSIVVFVTSSRINGQHAKSNVDNIVFCHCPAGLALLDLPESKPKDATLVKYGERLFIVDTIDKAVEKDGLTGYWLNVRHKTGYGYLQSSLLSVWPPVNDIPETEYLKDYLFTNFQANSGDKDFSFPETERCRTAKKCTLFTGIEYYGAGTRCEMTERLFISNLTVQEAYVVFSNFGFSFCFEPLTPALFKSSTTYNDEMACQSRFFERQGRHYRYHVQICYRKNDWGLNWIFYQFSWEAGAGTLEISKDGDDSVRIDHSYSCH